MSDKELVVKAVSRMPDAATMDEIREEVAILAAIRRGKSAADAGRVVSQSEVRAKSAQWTAD
jgi:predicted transcriptional regulator